MSGDADHVIEEEVWNAISAFEQILEAMPEDRASLEALAHAYEQIGDHTRAKEYLVRLAKVLVDSGEREEARGLADKLRPYAVGEPRVLEMLELIEGLDVGPVARTAREAGPPAERPAVQEELLVANFSIADELSVAWHLLENGELTQDEYASVVQDLTEMSAKDAGGTASVLHVLELRGARHLERIMRIIAQECGTPIVALGSFEIQKGPAGALPFEYMLRRGVLVFEFVGTHALAVVMNPYDDQLRKDVPKALGRKCHFFITLPSEFDRAMAKARDLLPDF